MATMCSHWDDTLADSERSLVACGTCDRCAVARAESPLVRYTVRTLNGERRLTGGQASDYMEAQAIARESARQLGTAVYLWFGDRAPVRVDC
jgi:hypothetical protein